MTFVPSEDSDQPGHPPSLIRVFAVRSVGSLGPNFASGGSESSLGAQIILLVLSCRIFRIETTLETISYCIITNLHMRN